MEIEGMTDLGRFHAGRPLAFASLLNNKELCLQVGRNITNDEQEISSLCSTCRHKGKIYPYKNPVASCAADADIFANVNS